MNSQLILSVTAIVLNGCAATAPKEAAIALAPFQDTYRWHPYHLSREAPKSADGVFQLVGVSKEGSAELIYQGGAHVVVKKDPSHEELVSSRMPMRVTQFDFVKQSVDFEWLTTN